MITVDIDMDDMVKVDPLVTATSAEATALIAEAIALIDLMDAADGDAPRLRVRVTGDTTAASCRHHPLSPGTIGDPRR